MDLPARLAAAAAMHPHHHLAHAANISHTEHRHFITNAQLSDDDTDDAGGRALPESKPSASNSSQHNAPSVGIDEDAHGAIPTGLLAIVLRFSWQANTTPGDIATMDDLCNRLQQCNADIPDHIDEIAMAMRKLEGCEVQLQ